MDCQVIRERAWLQVIDLNGVEPLRLDESGDSIRVLLGCP